MVFIYNIGDVIGLTCVVFLIGCFGIVKAQDALRSRRRRRS